MPIFLFQTFLRVLSVSALKLWRISLRLIRGEISGNLRKPRNPLRIAIC